MKLRIATRSSKLALWQANHFSRLILDNISGSSVEIVPIVTGGDRIQDRPLHEVEGKTLFIKEVEHALLEGRADVAVHCVKDYHPETPPEFVVAAFLDRESARDILITNTPISRFDDLPFGATIGTTSQRRIFFMKKARPDLKFAMLRGNIDSRLHKLSMEKYDAIVLAAAGLNRLGLHPENTLALDDETMLPAVGQGALAVEVCKDNSRLAKILGQFNHAPTQICIEAERTFVSGLSATCKSAVGVSCTHQSKGTVKLKGHVGHPETLEEISDEVTGDAKAAKQMAADLARQFLDRGAARLLED